MNRVVGEQDFASALAAREERRLNFVPHNQPTGASREIYSPVSNAGGL